MNDFPNNLPPLSHDDFPSEWRRLFDEWVPNWVKNKYLPSKKHRHLPFTDSDVTFFSKGVLELALMLTMDRQNKVIRSYFEHARFRSSYLLFYYPLQTAKFFRLFQEFEEACIAAVRHGKKNGKIEILDLGAGPGTASGAFLLWLKTQTRIKNLPPIVFHWIDQNKDIMADGKQILNGWIKKESKENPFPRCDIQFNALPLSKVKFDQSYSLILMGNVLNELSFRQSTELLSKMVNRLDGGGILIVEPAQPETARRLSKFRDQYLETRQLSEPHFPIWGPCLHQQLCPLSQGRDWCHFSNRVEIPGKVYQKLGKIVSQKFSGKSDAGRQWIKYSYLWIAAETFPAQKPADGLFRAVSDPIFVKSKPQAKVLLCDAETTKNFMVSKGSKIRRGDLVQLQPEFSERRKRAQ